MVFSIIHSLTHRGDVCCRVSYEFSAAQKGLPHSNKRHFSGKQLSHGGYDVSGGTLTLGEDGTTDIEWMVKDGDEDFLCKGVLQLCDDGRPRIVHGQCLHYKKFKEVENDGYSNLFTAELCSSHMLLQDLQQIV